MRPSGAQRSALTYRCALSCRSHLPAAMWVVLISRSIAVSSTLLSCCPTQAEEGGVTIRWLRGLGLVSAMSTAATAFASTALADPDLVSRPTPGMHVAGGNGGCTAAFAAQGNDGSYYLLTGGHCDPHDGSAWTYGEDRPLGMITASEKVGDTKDAAIIRLDPSVGAPAGDVGDRYPVRDVLSLPQIQVGMPFCKLSPVRPAAPSKAKTAT